MEGSPADHGTFLDAEAREKLVLVWRSHLRGGAETPEWSWLPPQWQEVAAATLEVVAGWKGVVKDRNAEDRVLAALVEGLERAEWEMRASPDHPANAPIARAMARRANEDPRFFAADADEILARIAREAPGGAYTVSALVSALASQGVLAHDPNGPGAQVQAEVVKNLVLGLWDRSLAARVVEWERIHLLEALAGVAQDLRRKQEAVRRITSALGAELAYAGFGADWSRGLYSGGAWDTLEQYARLVEGNRALAQLAATIGRLEEVRGRLEDEVVDGGTSLWRERALRGGRSEVRGIHLGDELDRLTAGDLALLADPDTELVFYLRFLEKRLLTYDMEGREVYSRRAPRARTRPVSRERERGPIILCLDTSGSMAGEPEIVAKALCLALLRTALREGRACWAISYSSAADLAERELTRMPEALPALLRFLAISFRGGTDPGPALSAALARLETATWDRADVLWVSDGLFTVDPDMLARVDAVKSRMDARFHVLLIGEASPPPFADAWWMWRTGGGFSPAALQLVRGFSRHARPIGAAPPRKEPPSRARG